MTPEEFLAYLGGALPADFSVTRFLKAGGQGAVFQGSFGGAPAAIKIFTPNRERYAREILLLQGISCETLVKLLGTGAVTIDGIECPIVAYEYLPGGDLTKHLAAGAAQLSEAVLCKIGCDIGKAVDALWNTRIVHRDIKPDNILEDATRFVLADVGIARHLDLGTITAAGRSPGTLGYMSPEQAAGRRALTKRADVFSLGVSLYYLAARRHPFNRDQTQIGRVIPPGLRTLRNDLSENFCAIVDRMISSDLLLRPLDAADQLCRIGGF